MDSLSTSTLLREFDSDLELISNQSFSSIQTSMPELLELNREKPQSTVINMKRKIPKRRSVRQRSIGDIVKEAAFVANASDTKWIRTGHWNRK